MWGLIKGWVGIPSLKTISVAVLIGLVCFAIFLGWRWLDDVLTTVETQHSTINTLNKSIGGKDQQIATLEVDRQSAKAEANFYAGKTEQLNQESQINAQKAKKYQTESNNLQQKLVDLQSNTQCAHTPVPDHLISVQRESIDAFNAQYSR